MRSRSLLLVGLLTALGACSAHPPEGFSSETTVSSIDVDRPVAVVVAAIRDEMVARSTRYEEVQDGSETRFLFGRGSVGARPLDASSTRLEVRLLEYNGPDYAARAAELRDAVVARTGDS